MLATTMHGTRVITASRWAIAWMSTESVPGERSAVDGGSMLSSPCGMAIAARPSRSSSESLMMKSHPLARCMIRARTDPCDVSISTSRVSMDVIGNQDATHDCTIKATALSGNLNVSVTILHERPDHLQGLFSIR